MEIHKVKEARVLAAIQPLWLLVLQLQVPSHEFHPRKVLIPLVELVLQEEIWNHLEHRIVSPTFFKKTLIWCFGPSVA